METSCLWRIPNEALSPSLSLTPAPHSRPLDLDEGVSWVREHPKGHKGKATGCPPLRSEFRRGRSRGPYNADSTGVVGGIGYPRESVLFIGTQFSILYTTMYSPAEAATPRLMFVVPCKYAHRRSQVFGL
jgi:hypothetical protein